MYRESIRNSYDQFAPGYRRIADYLLNHYQDAAFMTAAELGRQARVDTALVVRFAQRLGYPGFPELITDVQEDVKRDLRAVYEPPVGDDSPSQIMRRDLMQDRNNLDYMLLHYDAATVERVITELTRARRIYAVGEGGYWVEAFVMRLVLLGFPAHMLPNEIMGQAAMTAESRKGDVFIGVTMTALSLTVAVTLKAAREAGAFTVGVVGSLSNPLASAVDAVLLAPAKTTGIMPSWSATASLLHGLTQALALQSRGPSSDWVLQAEHHRRLTQAMLKEQVAGLRDVLQSYNAPTSPASTADKPEAAGPAG